jgi:heat shock protein HtpX
VARSRFVKDVGLTVRMTTVMFLLGLLFVVLVVGVMLVAAQSGYGGLVPVIGIAGIGVAFYQWWSSDKVAMKAMRAYEVTPEQMPELHGLIDRLCALAEMPKPRVGISEMDIPNAFATGRSPDRAVVCVTTGILGKLSQEELEGVLAHELSHVAHRDVLVMTVASSAGIVAGMLMQGSRFGALFGRRDRNGAAFFVVTLLISVLVYAVSFVLLRLLSRYRELCADRAAAYLTLKPGALATALQKITGEMAAIPQRDLRASKAMNAFFIAPAISGATLRTLTSTHPTLEQRLEQLARIQAELGRPTG